MSKKGSLIYLLGAGRSGTTLLATVLNNHPQIRTLGEMHQFLEHLKDNKPCSCGLPLANCDNWSPIVKQLKFTKTEIRTNFQFTSDKEEHSNIPGLLLLNKNQSKYLESQNLVFETIGTIHPEKWLLDSSKYIARYLLLKKSSKYKLKGIYMVRDVRGVINSFSKKVQTPRTPISTIFYYLLINFFGQLVSWLDKDVIKIKYEDFVEDTEVTLKMIYRHIFDSQQDIGELTQAYGIPHLIGGNRMKHNKNIKINADNNWKKKISRPKQIMYYLISFPMMIVNSYKI